MSAFGKYLRKAQSDGERAETSYLFWCPGCDSPHAFRVEGPADRPRWTFNGSAEKPTFSPSLLCFTTYDENQEPPKPFPDGRRVTLCHLFVTDGKIIFCGDSPHELAGQTVPLPEWPSP